MTRWPDGRPTDDKDEGGKVPMIREWAFETGDDGRRLRISRSQERIVVDVLDVDTRQDGTVIQTQP